MKGRLNLKRAVNKLTEECLADLETEFNPSIAADIMMGVSYILIAAGQTQEIGQDPREVFIKTSEILSNFHNAVVNTRTALSR